MRTEKINLVLYFLVFFFVFIGYYAILLTSFELGLHEQTRLVTVPVRLVVIASLVLLLLLNTKKTRVSYGFQLFLLFSFIYLLRLFAEHNKMVEYYIPMSEVLFYFLAFGFIPFLVLITQEFNKRHLNSIFNALLVGGITFSILSIQFYGRFIGQVGRLSSGTVNESVISPLALSYSSALIIGILAINLTTNKIRRRKHILFYIVIGLNTVKE